jgi:hypothetical protein
MVTGKINVKVKRRRTGVSVPTWLGFAHQQVPGFLVGAVLGFGEVGGEDDYWLVVGGADGEDLPGVGGDDPSASLRTG